MISKPKLAAGIFINFAVPQITIPLLATAAGWLYLRRATTGLEYHTKSVAYAFYLFAIYELLSISSLFSDSNNVGIYQLVSPLGPIWIIAHILLFIGSTILIKWAFYYLLKRINTQLFIIFTTTILTIFLLTTISFTFLLLKNISDETLSRLSTDTAVLSYAIDSKKSENKASASILAQNPEISTAITNNDRKVLSLVAEKLLISHKLTGVVITSETGQVLARGEDKDRIGDSISGDSVIKRALIGESISSITTLDGPLAPLVLVKSAVPVETLGKVVGAVLVTQALDNNFLDGIKKITGLEVAIYGDDTLSATTISDLSSDTRTLGIKTTNQDIRDTVLIKGKDYSNQIAILNSTYFASFKPLKDADNSVIGMLMAGRLSDSIFDTAGRSIELTFIMTVTLISLSTIPSYYLAKYLSDQLK